VNFRSGSWGRRANVSTLGMVARFASNLLLNAVLSKKVDLEAMPYNCTALGDASMSQNWANAKSLVEAGADLYRVCKDSGGYRSALLFVQPDVARASGEYYEFLLKRWDFSRDSTGKEKYLALSLTTLPLQLRYIRYFVDVGADPHKLNFKDLGRMDLPTNALFLLAQLYNKGVEAVPVLNYLLSLGLRPDRASSVDGQKASELSVVVLNSNQGRMGFIDDVSESFYRSLVQMGANVQAPNLLSELLHKNAYGMFAELVQMGVSVDGSSSRRPPLNEAMDTGQSVLGSIYELLRLGANVNSVDPANPNCSALCLARVMLESAQRWDRYDHSVESRADVREAKRLIQVLVAKGAR
jgi:hypothetical protein